MCVFAITITVDNLDDMEGIVLFNVTFVCESGAVSKFGKCLSK